MKNITLKSYITSMIEVFWYSTLLIVVPSILYPCQIAMNEISVIVATLIGFTIDHSIRKYTNYGYSENKDFYETIIFKLILCLIICALGYFGGYIK